MATLSSATFTFVTRHSTKVPCTLLYGYWVWCIPYGHSVSLITYFFEQRVICAVFLCLVLFEIALVFTACTNNAFSWHEQLVSTKGDFVFAKKARARQYFEMQVVCLLQLWATLAYFFAALNEKILLYAAG